MALAARPLTIAGEGGVERRGVALVEGDDELPDMAIGRIPVQYSTEADEIVNKIIAYDSCLLYTSDAADE